MTLYSNRLVIIKKTPIGLFTAKSVKLTKEAYAEILSKANSLPHEGRLTSAFSRFDDATWALWIDGKTYYTSTGQRDEVLYDFILLVDQYVRPLLENIH
jgi:hypothetical protein